MNDIRQSSRSGMRALAFAMLFVLSSAQAAVEFFNQDDYGTNLAAFEAWQGAVLDAPGARGIAVINFESVAFTDGQDISGDDITGTWPDPIRITTAPGPATIETGDGSITKSDPMDNVAVEINRTSTARIDFLLPTFAAAFVVIDTQALPFTIGFSDSTWVSYLSEIDETGSDGDTGEFHGIFLDPAQDGRRISYLEFGLAASGDDTWGLDNIMYQVPEPSSLALMGLVGLGLLSRRRRRA